jgi:hypothetical protein
MLGRFMIKRVTAVIAAAMVAVFVNFFGVVFFFRPISEGDSVGWVPPPLISFLVYVALSVIVLDWAVQRLGKPMKVAVVIALSQVILVIDLVLRGDRGVATGAAGVVLIVVTWTAMGFAYSKALP